MITDAQRHARSKNIEQNGCVEEPCPECKNGMVLKPVTRIAGTAMNEHLRQKHNAQDCSCPRSTVSVKEACGRCGGFGTIAKNKAA